MLKINRFWWKYFKKVILFYKALHNIIEIKCQLNRLYQHIFFWSLKTTQKRYMILFKTKSTTAVDPQHLKVKEQDISLTRNYCIIVSIQIISSIHTFILKIQQILESCEPVPRPDVFEHTFFLKLRIGQFSDTKKPSMIVVECRKIFDVQCIWGRIFVSLEKIFVFKYSQTIFHLVFTRNIYGKSVTRNSLGANTVQTLPKYIWMRHCELKDHCHISPGPPKNH